MGEPVLKWLGGKRQLLDELYSRFPSTYDQYHEPFLGGGAVFFDLEPAAGSINDTNPRLVNFYRQMRDNPSAVIKHLRTFKHPEVEPAPDRPFTSTDRSGREIENYYYQQRALYNRRVFDESFDAVEEAALLLYLNRTCFNGLYRENSNGKFNAPIGEYVNPDWVQADRIRAASDALKAADIHNRDFEYVAEVAAPGALVYFDPPYKPASATEDFTEYSADGFGQADQQRLLSVAQELDEQGVYVIISNSGVMYDSYKDTEFDVEVEGAARAINSDATNRGEVDEIIATNVPESDRQAHGQQPLTEF